ncbi:helix-turn-helix domain-containing protein [Croceicoccus mobilis]|uniref:Cro/Cl family transcriptional regulator n=1 Tax=Croceicoccus mobilis TaxID=1703339 RepID=A0A917DY61_9SPHN|nr:XRE family transcriptional regulator [Croceicoccus mobilis]GGD77904.1 Cro/Cl family transcriptional regulator [Croceicoccus mobilis]
MTRPQRIFAGKTLRALRDGQSLKQAEMAETLGISVSYLSQLESDDRPLTPRLIAALSRRYDLKLDEAGAEGSWDSIDLRAEALRRAASDPLFPHAIDEATATRAVRQQPHLAERFVALHGAYRHAGERLQMLDEALEAGEGASPNRLPWEEVRDWFHEQGNYIDILDRRAETVAAGIAPDLASPSEAALLTLAATLGVTVANGGAGMREYDDATATLTIDASQPAETRRFQLAWQLAGIALAGEIAQVTASSGLASQAARDLLRIGLGNYAAGSLLMPYEAFRLAALSERHDIDRLCQRFSVSFEQACHRLSTLQREGARGIPFFFCRVDMAGNITKRHSATALQFARFGGACPLWIVHEAVAIPDRILTQLAETPDGVRYISMAKGLVKPSGSYTRPPRRYAVALGCEAQYAGDFIYADGLDVGAKGAATPIGISCRLCPRENCDQRAFPPGDRTIVVDPAQRGVVPYRIG